VSAGTALVTGHSTQHMHTHADQESRYAQGCAHMFIATVGCRCRQPCKSQHKFNIQATLNTTITLTNGKHSNTVVLGAHVSSPAGATVSAL
jgi:hypothetical protein